MSLQCEVTYQKIIKRWLVNMMIDEYIYAKWTMNDEYVCIAVYNERWTMIYKYDVHWGDDASYTCYLSDERWYV